MSLSCQYDVIVVGCGPVGVTAAHLLGHHGLSTLVIERDSGPYDLPRAVHLDHEIMRIFQSAGLADMLLPQLTMPAGAMHFGSDRGVIRQFQEIVTTDRLGWGSDYFFYQPDMERALQSALRERSTVELLYGHQVTNIAQDDQEVTVFADHDGKQITAKARYLLACDGGRSIVRKSVGIALDDLGFDEPWIVVDAIVDSPVLMPDLIGVPEGVDMQQVMFIVGDPARPTSVIPGVGKHRRWEFMMLPGEAPDDFDDPAAIAALIAPWLGDAPYELVRSAVYRFHALLAERWRSDRILLVGDAAHQTPPFFGQGLCHGIRDAANLVWKLKLVLDRVATPALLDSYQIERLPQVRSVIEASMRVGRYICTLDPEAAKQRDVEMRSVAMRTPPGYVDLIPSLVSGILSEIEGEPSPVGSRFIQPPVRDVVGQTKLLDDATGGGFVLLARSRDMLLPPSNPTFEASIKLRKFVVMNSDENLPNETDTNLMIDHSGELAQWFDYYKCDGVILRPDAYVFGTFSNADQANDLISSLREKIIA